MAIAVGSLLWLVAALAGVRLLPAGHWVLAAYSVGMPILAVGILGLGFLRAGDGRVVALAAALAAAGLLLSAGLEVAVLLGNPPGPWATAVAVGGLGAESLFAVVMLVDGTLPRFPLMAIAVLAAALGISAYLTPDYVTWGTALLPMAWLALCVDIMVAARPERQAA
jgi:hypothetical protein